MVPNGSKGNLRYTIVDAWADDTARHEADAAHLARMRRENAEDAYDAEYVIEWFIRLGWVGGGEDDGYAVYYPVEVGSNRPIRVEALSEHALCALMRLRCPKAVRVLDPHEGRFAS